MEFLFFYPYLSGVFWSFSLTLYLFYTQFPKFFRGEREKVAEKLWMREKVVGWPNSKNKKDEFGIDVFLLTRWVSLRWF